MCYRCVLYFGYILTYIDDEECNYKQKRIIITVYSILALTEEIWVEEREKLNIFLNWNYIEV